MPEADQILKDVLEANRARELLFRREADAVSSAGGLLAAALGSGRTLYVVGAGELALIARAVAQTFVAGDAGAPLRAIPLASEVAHGAAAVPEHALVREVRAFVDRCDLLLAFLRDATPGPVVSALDAARAKGASTVVVCGYPGESLVPHADAVIVVPSRRGPVIADASLAIGHALARVVGRRLGLEAQKPAGDPFDSGHLRAESLKSSSSDEVVVAELVAPHSSGGGKRHASSSVELVPLYVDERSGPAAPAANAIRFKCQSCGETISVEARFTGRSGQCPRCLNDFVIPPASEASLPQPAVPTLNAPASPSASAARRAAQGSPHASNAGRARPTPPPVAAKPEGAAQAQEERRRARRVNVKDAVVSFGRGAFPDDEEQPAGRHALDDLSLTGLSFTIQTTGNGAPARVGEALHVLLDFPAFVDRIKVLADVRRVEALAGGSSYTVGIRFSRFLDDAQAKVRRLVENDALRGVRRR